MSTSVLSRNEVCQRFDHVFMEMVERLQRSVPTAQCRSHHGSNDSFVWRVVARFSNSANEAKIIDVSVDCRSRGTSIQIRADVAREDGLVLEEFIGEEIPTLPRNGEGVIVGEEEVDRVQAFLLEQVDRISRELA
jgi:hypothetical protein